MKTVPYTNTTGGRDAPIVPSPDRVCMHVWGVARTDFRVMREATALIEAGFSVSIVDLESEHSRPVEEDIRGVCIKHIIRPKWFIPTRFKLWFLIRAAQMFILGTWQLLRTRADIYHAHDVKALPGCYIAARLRRKPFIFDAHELPLSEPGVTRWHRLSGLARRLLAYMTKRCARVITTSPFYAKEIRRSYHCLEVSLIRNFPVYRAVPKSNRLREHLGLGPEVRIALYQGYLLPDRSLDRLIRAAALLEQDIVIVMMGKGDGATLSELEALVASEGVADRVKILPPVPYEELLDWTASADIGLTLFSPDYSPSIRMTLPNKLFEYLMAGLPVLSSPLDAIEEVINTYDVGRVVSSLAPADVAAAITSMLVDQQALARMRGNALEAARSEFYWEKESQQLIGLYRDVLGIEHVDAEVLTPYV
jgi:glycosyltransferase involved in cell wall biosynthesis